MPQAVKLNHKTLLKLKGIVIRAAVLCGTSMGLNVHRNEIRCQDNADTHGETTRAGCSRCEHMPPLHTVCAEGVFKVTSNAPVVAVKTWDDVPIDSRLFP